MRKIRTITRITSVRTKATITAAEIRKAFNLAPGTRLTVHVPGGGDWSNTDLDLDEHNISTTQIVETTEYEEVTP